MIFVMRKAVSSKWEVGSGKLFRSILRTSLRGGTTKQSCLVKSRKVESHKVKRIKYIENNYCNKKFCHDHRIWQASIKKEKLPLRNTSCLRLRGNERASFCVLGSEPLVDGRKSQVLIFCFFFIKEKEKLLAFRHDWIWVKVVKSKVKSRKVESQKS